MFNLSDESYILDCGGSMCSWTNVVTTTALVLKLGFFIHPQPAIGNLIHLKKKKKTYQSGLLLGVHYAVWLSK